MVHTSAGYPIKDFDVQAWNGVTYVTVGSVHNNTAEHGGHVRRPYLEAGADPGAQQPDPARECLVRLEPD
ncbi:hypothetical protein AOZ06_47490 [Kibdelosporangium phytohabitans]|uniref:Uncharacterized protein n=1 Tax=Kibdelosporangium phytohabitans TaxID=860235 RepID=A0A0N9IF93_9PSEU|nr:hypothetical protein AOZ06_47490 [Kibdelosporangium phytohabitans]